MKLNYIIEIIIIIIIIIILNNLICRSILQEPIPYLDINRKGAKVLVLSCIDPRFTERLAHFLIHDEQIHADYDLINLAGASLGVLQEKYPSWKTMFYDHVNLAIDLHNIKEIWCFDHLDCGMYKATLGLEEDLDTSTHNHNISELANIIKEKYPKIKFKGFIILTDGNIVPAK